MNEASLLSSRRDMPLAIVIRNSTPVSALAARAQEKPGRSFRNGPRVAEPATIFYCSELRA
jgi:hypothetical protein